jgi:dipeptidyl aminopeptidase/acylaminoacyl peptidase
VTARRLLLSSLAIVVLAWAFAPAVRGVLLVRHAGAPFATAIAGAEAVRFATRDGVELSGSYLPTASAAGTVILVHGFKRPRVEMLPWADLVRPAYSVLLFDSRGTGSSGGTFGVGATEPRDIIAAVDFIVARKGPGSGRIAVLGVSLGAGDAILAGAEDRRIDAVIADSTWADERVQLERMYALPVGPLAIPVLPYEPALVDALIGGRLEDARPRDAAARIAPRALFLIHSADDGNATTTVSDAQAVFAAAGPPKQLWLAPSGGHAGALPANRAEYRDRLLAFLESALR